LLQTDLAHFCFLPKIVFTISVKLPSEMDFCYKFVEAGGFAVIAACPKSTYAGIVGVADDRAGAVLAQVGKPGQLMV
jgi:hypothetical protein